MQLFQVYRHPRCIRRGSGRQNRPRGHDDRATVIWQAGRGARMLAVVMAWRFSCGQYRTTVTGDGYQQAGRQIAQMRPKAREAAVES